MMSGGLSALRDPQGMSGWGGQGRGGDVFFIRAVEMSYGRSLFGTLLINFSYIADLANSFIHFPSGGLVRALHLHTVMVLALSVHLN